MSRSWTAKAAVCVSLVALTLVGGLAALACDEKLSTLGGPTPDLEPTFRASRFEGADIHRPFERVLGHNTGSNLQRDSNGCGQSIVRAVIEA
jgi:hypothetical protein